MQRRQRVRKGAASCFGFSVHGPMSAGDDVFCAPEESVAICPAPGLATRLASPCEHEACSISSQVEAYKLVLFGQVSSQAFAGVGVRLVAVPGGAAHAGLLEMEMEAGGYGTVCGLNSQAPGCQCGLPTDWL